MGSGGRAWKTEKVIAKQRQRLDSRKNMRELPASAGRPKEQVRCSSTADGVVVRKCSAEFPIEAAAINLKGVRRRIRAADDSSNAQ